MALFSHLQEIFFLWRPLSPDKKDDMILELAIAANCHYIVKHNIGDFGSASTLGVEVISPAGFPRRLGAVS